MIESGLMTDIVGWDVATWSTAVTFWDVQVGDTPRRLRCLEVGAGPGGPSLWLALRGHDVVCTNQATTEHDAGPLHEAYGMRDRIEYRDVDVTRLPYEDEFDIVVVKSVLGGVGQDGIRSQQAAVDGMHRALKSGGRLLFAENIRGTVLHRLARWVAYRMRGTSWRYLTLGEFDRLLGGFGGRRLVTTGVLAMFGTTETARRRLARVDQAVLNRVVPSSWHYVAYGVATK